MTEVNYQLIYISVASYRFSQEELTNLLKKSREFNSKNEITGLLLYSGGQFMQLLEGSRETIKDLMVRIARDTRHHHVEVLEEGSNSQRQFSDWSMAFLDFASSQVRALPGYSTFLDGPFKPGEMVDLTGERTMALHYFKAVSAASESSLLRLADTIRQKP